ncbi:MAG: tail fiber domain-containing protein [Parafilimonas sp.]
MKTKSIIIISICVLISFTTFTQSTPVAADTAVNLVNSASAQPLILKVNNQKAGYIDYDLLKGNTGFGYQSLNFNLAENLNGIGNSAFGSQSLSVNTKGNFNTAAGFMALTSNLTGNSNTAYGSQSLYANTIGTSNTATGYTTLYSNITGAANTANGYIALYYNTTGSANTANGFAALINNTTGNFNTAGGRSALSANKTGSYNTALGDSANVTADNLTNATAIGYTSLADASNKIRLGNGSVTSIGGQVGWTTLADERMQENVQENVHGLDFIKALRPVTFNTNLLKQNLMHGITDRNEWEGKYDIDKIQFSGFVAQDVDKAAKNTGYNFSGIDSSGNILGLRYSDFVVPLTKAVQELSAANDTLKTIVNNLRIQNDSLQSQLKALINRMNAAEKSHQQISSQAPSQTEIVKLHIQNDSLQSQLKALSNQKNAAEKSQQKISSESSSQSEIVNLPVEKQETHQSEASAQTAHLEQNTPNPYTSSTSIGYYIPFKINNAQLIISDVSGTPVQTITLKKKGSEKITITAIKRSQPGNYIYTLIVDGKKVDSKQMELIR